MKKGFTLVELLAVIIILAIISLIATPVALNIIRDSKKSTFDRSIDFYLKAVNLSKSNSELSGKDINNGLYPIMENGNICLGIYENKSCKGDVLEVEINGNKPIEGIVRISNVTTIDYIKFGEKIYYKENNEYIEKNSLKEKIDSEDTLITINTDTNVIPNFKIYGSSDGVGNYDKEIKKYNIPIKMTGKNLFNINKITDVTNILNNGDNTLKVTGGAVNTTKKLSQLAPQIKVGDILTFSLRITNALQDTKEKTYIYLLEMKKVIDGGKSYIITQEMLDSKVYLYCRTYGTDVEQTPYGIISEMQLEYGNNPTFYEPYTEKIYHIYLDEPLRCIENVCDYIDYSNGKLVRKVKENSSNNLIELENPIMENIELQQLKPQNGVNNIFVETSNKPSKIELEYYK